MISRHPSDRARCVWIFLAALLASGEASAQATTYTYTGNAFTEVPLGDVELGPSYFVTVSVTFDSPLAPGQPIPAIMNWTFSDGRHFGSSDNDGDHLGFDTLTLDACGNIAVWRMGGDTADGNGWFTSRSYWNIYWVPEDYSRDVTWATRVVGHQGTWNPGGNNGGFSLSVSPATQTVSPGGSTSFGISIVSACDFDQNTVRFSCETDSPEIACTVYPAAGDRHEATMTVSVSPKKKGRPRKGSYTVTVIGSWDGVLEHRTPVTVVVGK